MKKIAFFTALTAVMAFGTPALADLNIVCQKTDSAGTLGDTILTFTSSSLASRRLLMDLNETRSSSDAESIPSYKVAQFQLSKSRLFIQTDDGGATGTVDATLDVVGKRVPPGQTGVLGYWTGTYKRAAPFREFEAKVTCGAYEQ